MALQTQFESVVCASVVRATKALAMLDFPRSIRTETKTIGEREKIDLSKVDINTLKIKELKQALHDVGGVCKGCTEKAEFLRELSKYVPKKKEL
jgi:hypothetical protein